MLGLAMTVAACGAEAPSRPVLTEPAQPTEPAEVPSVALRPLAASEPRGATPVDGEGEAETGAHAEAAVPVTPGTVRVVALHEHELLGSESRAVGAIEAALEGRGMTVEIATPEDDEASVAREWLAGTKPASLPAAWRTVETVLVLHVAPPLAQRSGRSVARGVDGILVVRPPSRDPIFAARADEGTPIGIVTSQAALGPWLADLLEGAAEGAAR